MSNGFAKLDSEIVNSTLWVQPHDVLRVWIALLAQADGNGLVRSAAPALAHLCMIPLDRMREIICLLESPDPDSRSSAEEGRRIAKVEGGWMIINYRAYRERRQTEDRKDYQRRWDAENRPHRDRKSSEPDTTRHDPTNPTKAEAEAEAKDKNPSGSSPQASPADHCPHEKIIEIYHEVLPELPKVRIWDEGRQKLLRSRWREDSQRQSVDWWRGYFEYVRRSPFLLGQVSSGGRDPFLADLEWLIRPSNFRKVIEGRYERSAA